MLEEMVHRGLAKITVMLIFSPVLQDGVCIMKNGSRIYFRCFQKQNCVRAMVKWETRILAIIPGPPGYHPGIIMFLEQRPQALRAIRSLTEVIRMISGNLLQ